MRPISPLALFAAVVILSALPPFRGFGRWYGTLPWHHRFFFDFAMGLVPFAAERVASRSPSPPSPNG